MCNNFPNIKVVEGNAFSVLVPLKVRTFESCSPIDEDIDPTQLSNVVFKFGGVSYTPIVDERGVSAVLPATLARGTYDIVLTANYGDNPIRAAYESAITIVPWNSQSDAQQYIAGSPIVLDAAYVIGGTLTDAELEALKEEYREKNAQLQQAIEDAEAAKAEWEQKAADIDGVAQEATSQEILTAVENIDIDTSDLAKEDTAQEILQKVSVGADALEVEVEDGKAAIVDAIEDKGGTASTAMSLTGLAQAIDSIQVPTLMRLNAITFENAVTNKVIDMGGIEVLNIAAISFNGYGAVEKIRNFPQMPNLTSLQSLFSNCSSLISVDFRGLDTSHVTNWRGIFSGCTSIREIDMSPLNSSACTYCIQMFYNCSQLEKLDIRNFHFVGAVQDTFQGVTSMKEVDMRNTDASGLTSYMFLGLPISSYNLTTLVGDATYEEIVDGDIKVFGGINVNMGTSLAYLSLINRASLRAIINGLADRTGQSALTLSGLGAVNLAKLSAEDIAVATAKNWNITA